MKIVLFLCNSHAKYLLEETFGWRLLDYAVTASLATGSLILSWYFDYLVQKKAALLGNEQDIVLRLAFADGKTNSERWRI